MTKNYLKTLLAGFGIGCIIGKIYDWGKEDGKLELVSDVMANFREAVEETTEE